MTDLHGHILPVMYDGAKNTAVSLELLRREYEDGVRNIAFTSHFNSERTTVEAFTVKRQTAFEQLTAALEGYEGVEYTCCWQYAAADRDGNIVGEWQDAQSGTLTMSYELTAENLLTAWRMSVTVVEPAPEAEPAGEAEAEPVQEVLE